MSISKKLILVIGATGAQGLAVVDALLKPGPDGAPSPYAVRALTRDSTSERAQELAGRGVELAEGHFEDFASVKSALQGVYGAWINTDGFTVGETKEIHIAMRIFEIAKQTKSIRHYVWSNLDYALKKGNWDPMYECGHYNGKGRVADWLKAQPSDPSDTGMSWTVVTSGPYMDMLEIPTFGPLNKRKDGTFVFATPVGKGHVAMIALEDLGFWARYAFDHREELSTKDLEVASDMVGWDYLKDSFERATGNKATVVYQTIDDWMKNLDRTDYPIANEREYGDGSTTWRENFTGFWSMWRDDVIKRDMNWIRKVNPETYTVEKWMREHEYTGELTLGVLKNVEDDKGIIPNRDVTSKL
ncbi:NAD(P)-binding protein [Trametopsis cervina]|nr:NAD(P)-binding protein [Trametopsis cervina]